MLILYLETIESDSQKEKFEFLYKKYAGFIFKVAYNIIKDQNLAEDAVHEVFLQLMNELDNLRIENTRELKSYLYTVTKGKTIDYLRKWNRLKIS